MQTITAKTDAYLKGALARNGGMPMSSRPHGMTGEILDAWLAGWFREDDIG